MPVNSFDTYPMSWKPSLDKSSKTPIYILLADMLKNDILDGVLTPGTKLPPQRELADFLDINLSTVTRAFKLCEQRGLICSVTGSGTFVSSDAASHGMLLIQDTRERLIQMGPILPNPDISEIATGYLKSMTKEPDFYKLLQYASTDLDELQIMACRKWMSYLNFDSPADNLLFSMGSQNGIFACLASLFQEGDKIATTGVTYPGLKIAAKTLGIQIIPLSLKDNAFTRDSLEYAYKNHNIKGFYFIPDFNNPSGEQLSLECRKMIGDFCTEHSLPCIEDCIYSLFQPDPLPPISAFAKDQGIIIASVSKIMSPGLRLAIMRVPAQYASDISTTLYSMQITPPALMMQLFTRLVNSGRFDEIRRLRIQELTRRNQLFEDIFSGIRNNGHANSPIRWLSLPDSLKLSSVEFEDYMLKRDVQIFSAGRFVIGNTPIPRAVRISLISEHNESRYIEGIKILRSALGH